MKPFRFRLEGLLRLRKIQEDRCRQELAECRATAAEYDQELADIAAERQQLLVSERREGDLDMAEVLTGQRHLNTLLRRAHDVARARAEIEVKVRGAQEKLSAARRQREVVERLRERQYEEYQGDLKREEQSAMDEVARQLFVAGEGSHS